MVNVDNIMMMQQAKTLMNRTKIFRNSGMNPFRTYNNGNNSSSEKNIANKTSKGFDMTKNLPRYINSQET